MKSLLADLLIDPASGAKLVWNHDGGSERLVGPAGMSIPIRDTIPRFIEDESFVSSFGYQWTHFDVAHRDEDEKTFVAKTGVPLAELKGKLVLDAGCGGGRYSRVAAENGAAVIGVDRSAAVDKARALNTGLENAAFVQCDLLSLPLPKERFDLVFSIGVLHHSPDPRASFRSIAALVKRGGRLSIWLYRKNTWLQERINDCLRRRARRMSRERLLDWCRFGARLGGIPVLNRTLNKFANFSNHPCYENRVCDTFDWYSPTYQYHHTRREVFGWFADAGFGGIAELPPEKTAKLYVIAWRAGLIVGSGVNVTGVRQ